MKKLVKPLILIILGILIGIYLSYYWIPMCAVCVV